MVNALALRISSMLLDMSGSNEAVASATWRSSSLSRATSPLHSRNSFARLSALCASSASEIASRRPEVLKRSFAITFICLVHVFSFCRATRPHSVRSVWPTTHRHRLCHGQEVRFLRRHPLLRNRHCCPRIATRQTLPLQDWSARSNSPIRGSRTRHSTLSSPCQGYSHGNLPPRGGW